MSLDYDLAVLGGGAAGFFAAISAAEHQPRLRIILLEKSARTLSKVLVSGGGRCNVTHDCRKAEELINFYPRGHEFLLPVFQQFGVKDTIAWFKQRGVQLKTEEDGRMFPITDSSETIANCLTREAKKLGIQIQTHAGTVNFSPNSNGFLLASEKVQIQTKKLILAIGGTPKDEQLSAFRKLGINCIPPVPSLFTFNLKPHPYKNLLGLSLPNAKVQISGLSKPETGPILITHWGLSGPAVIKCSAWQARKLAASDYSFSIRVSWLDLTKGEVMKQLQDFAQQYPKKSLATRCPFDELPNRLWRKMLDHMDIPEFRNWAEAGKKTLTKITDKLTADELQAKGKTTFKEEFVTAGGIDLEEIDTDFQVTQFPGLYAVGELLNIDAVTGGFNFQAAWSGGYLAGKHAASQL